MVIVFVTDIYCDAKNGTSMTAHRFVEALRQRGHEVRVLAIGEPGPDNYYVNEARYGFASRIGHSQGFGFAKFDQAVVRQALEGADIVHFLLPMPFELQVLQIAKEMGIPYSAAFHMQPENATHILHLSKIKGLDHGIYKLLWRMFYRHFRHIHCPSKFIAGELQKHNYAGKFYVISNGVGNNFVPAKTNPQRDSDCFHILMTGRLSPEKRQEVLIEAVKRSKYRNKIQIHFAGDGPCRERLVRKGLALQKEPIIQFYSQPELIELIHRCDLYVHTATVEIEAIACLEAIACGLVPVICNSDKSATVQFAQDERSLFRADDPDDLAKKIDYWIEHPEEKQQVSAGYARYGNSFRVEDSVQKAEFMFLETIRDFQERGKSWRRN